MSKTALQLRTEIINQLWPSGAPENLTTAPSEGALSPYEQNFNAALAEVCKWVEGEQVLHTDVVPFCNTYFKCGQSVVSLPAGIVRRVGTLITNDYCSTVWYREVDLYATEWLGRRLMDEYDDQLTVPTATLPLGFALASSGTDTDYRAEAGIWAKQRKNLHLAPWINSEES